MGKYYALSQQVIEVGDTFQSVADALAELEARVNTLEAQVNTLEATSKRIYNGCELPVKEMV